MAMKKKILIVCLIVWFLVFATDVICACAIQRPVFMLLGGGGCIDPYFGLGYTITFYSAPPLPGEPVIHSGPEIHPWLYIIANAAIIGILIFKRRRNKRLEISP
ncbi:MAG: hypothetical protein FWF60_03040 [Oscillospiraceae bacterium]|nr:hypothetical protein [Oscillospiraceae bacterium]